MATLFASETVNRCPSCGHSFPLSFLSCPSCGRLVHATRLQELAASAQTAESRKEVTEAVRLWREALELLPPNTEQFQKIATHLAKLSQTIDQTDGSPKEKPAWVKRLGLLAPLALLLWKFKAFVLLALTKGKLLVLGLTKLGTLSTMLLSTGAYWTMYGWPFAVGLVLSIYIHEMGHIYRLQRFGIRATAPLFIPFVGAVIGLRQRAFSRIEEARIGLAGPAWGLAAAVATFALYWLTGIPVLKAIAHFATWVNLFNLLPVWQLDGSHGLAPLTRVQRGLLLIVMLALWVVTHEGLLVLMAAALTFRLFPARDLPKEGDNKTLREFAGILICLGLLLTIH